MEGSPGMFCDVMKKDMDCKALFESEDIDKPSKFDPPPRTLPKLDMPFCSYSFYYYPSFAATSFKNSSIMAELN